MGDNERIDNENNADDEDLLYETNEKGEKVLVRSLQSLDPAFVRFVNKTARPVDLWWRDFRGRKRYYMRIIPKAYINIDTYISHPWEFLDPVTKENLFVNRKKIFRAPATIAGMRHRTNWIISIGMRPLRSTAMLTLAQLITDQSKVRALGLPRELESDLEQLVDAIQHAPPPPPRP